MDSGVSREPGNHAGILRKQSIMSYDTVKILASVASIADDSRMSTSSVRVNHRRGTSVTFAATNGATAVIARVPRVDPETNGAAVYRAADIRTGCKYAGTKGYVSFEPGNVLAFFPSIEPGAVPVRVSPRTDGVSFPELDRVIPAQVKRYDCGWFDPNLMLAHMRMHAALFGKERIVSTAFEVGNPGDPARLCSRTRDNVTMLSVVMPVRVDMTNADGIVSEVMTGYEVRVLESEAAE